MNGWIFLLNGQSTTFYANSHLLTLWLYHAQSFQQGNTLWISKCSRMTRLVWTCIGTEEDRNGSAQVRRREKRGGVWLRSCGLDCRFFSHVGLRAAFGLSVYCSYVCLFIQMLHSINLQLNLWHLHNYINWAKGKYNQAEDRSCLQHTMHRGCNVILLNAVVMLTQVLSPTWATSGAEPWLARLAGKRLRVLSHRLEARCKMRGRKEAEIGELMN